MMWLILGTLYSSHTLHAPIPFSSYHTFVLGLVGWQKNPGKTFKKGSCQLNIFNPSGMYRSRYPDDKMKAIGTSREMWQTRWEERCADMWQGKSTVWGTKITLRSPSTASMIIYIPQGSKWSQMYDSIIQFNHSISHNHNFLTRLLI